MPLHLTVQRTVDTLAPDSPRVRKVAAMFGLGVDAGRSATIVPPTSLTLEPGQIVFITGASGGGKSTLLRLIGDAARQRGHRVITLTDDPLPEKPIVDLLPDRPLEQVLKTFAGAGLSDAFVLLRLPSQLSDGQRCRLRLALALAEAERSTGADAAPGFPVVLADELGATLDRVTAAVIARNLRKWVTRTGVCLVAATTHDDLLAPLAPDLLLEKGLGPRITIVERGECPQMTQMSADSEHGSPSILRQSAESAGLPLPLTLEPGTLADYAELADLHYRAGKPATATRVLVWRRSAPTVVGRYLARSVDRQVVAVLVESLPSLSCAMRDVATAGRYRGVTARARAMMLNDELRTISRVVVHPQWRGLGLARSLVERALAEATTPYIEALAAMGQVHPFFEQAGMTRYDRPPHPADARLRDALATRGAVDDHALLDDPLILAELHRWRRIALRNHGPSDPAPLLRTARERLHFRPVYYLWRGAGGGGGGGLTTETRRHGGGTEQRSRANQEQTQDKSQGGIENPVPP